MVDNEVKKPSIAEIIENNKREREAAEARAAALEARIVALEASNEELTGAILGGAVPHNKPKTGETSTPKTLDDFIANELAKSKK